VIDELSDIKNNREMERQAIEAFMERKKRRKVDGMHHNSPTPRGDYSEQSVVVNGESFRVDTPPASSSFVLASSEQRIMIEALAATFQGGVNYESPIKNSQEASDGYLDTQAQEAPLDEPGSDDAAEEQHEQAALAEGQFDQQAYVQQAMAKWGHLSPDELEQVMRGKVYSHRIKSLLKV
jgi:hypothetical protein